MKIPSWDPLFHEKVFKRDTKFAFSLDQMFIKVQIDIWIPNKMDKSPKRILYPWIYHEPKQAKKN